LNAASSTAGFQYSRWCRSPHLVHLMSGEER
jgi:hypothetical protein